MPYHYFKCKEKKIKQIKEALAEHDWYYEMTEDFSKWEAGRNNEKALIYELNKLGDPKLALSLWNEFAPDQYKLYEWGHRV